MKKKYSIEWSIFDDVDLVNAINESYPEVLVRAKPLTLPNQLLGFDSLDFFHGYRDGHLISRPEGSRRAYYISESDEDEVIAVKGTEAGSSELKNAMETNSSSTLPHRPWTKFENFIYREQKAPLAMLFNEAKQEAEIGIDFQKSIFKTFGFFEEAPLPLLVFKWSSDQTSKYIKTITPYLDQRARELLFPLIDTYGIGGIVYHYKYLPTRVRFSINKICEQEKFSAIDNLIEIVARLLIAGYLPFDFEDHGIGQCVAPQNVTNRGGICDLGSIKKIKGIPEGRIFDILRALGSILTRTLTEMLGKSVSDLVYEFDNPTTLQHYLSVVVHNKLAAALQDQAQDKSVKLNAAISTYYSPDYNNLARILGIK